MRYFWSALIGLGMSVVPAMAEAQEGYHDWISLSPEESGVVIFLVNTLRDAGIQLTLNGKDEKLLDKSDWAASTPILRQYRVSPGTYDIHVGSTQQQVVAEPGKMTFLKISPYPQSGELHAVPVSDTHRELRATFTKLSRIDEALLRPVVINDAPKDLYLSAKTEPPWDIPNPTRPLPLPPRPPKQGEFP